MPPETVAEEVCWLLDQAANIVTRALNITTDAGWPADSHQLSVTLRSIDEVKSSLENLA